MKYASNLLFALLIICALVLPISLSTKSVSATPGGSWLPGWELGYRRLVTINQAAIGTATTGKVIQLTVAKGASGGNISLNSHSTDTDWTDLLINDLRFTMDDGITLQPYYIADVTANIATVFIRVSADVNGAGTVILYCYYGVSGKVCTSDGSAVFDGFSAWTGGGTAKQTPVSGRYFAFGMCVRTGQDTIQFYGQNSDRQEWGHSGIVRIPYTISTNSWGSYSTIYTDPNPDLGCMNIWGGVIYDASGNPSIYLFFGRDNNVYYYYQDAGYIHSLDGITGNSWSTYTSITSGMYNNSPGTYTIPFGHLVQFSDAPGSSAIAVYTEGGGGQNGDISKYVDYENFTTYIKVNGATITVPMINQINVSGMTNGGSSYIYTDLGISHFNSIATSFNAWIYSSTADGGSNSIGITNTLGSADAWTGNDISIKLSRSGASYTASLMLGTTVKDSRAISPDKQYGFVVKRAAGGTSVTVDIYLPSAGYSPIYSDYSSMFANFDYLGTLTCTVLATDRWRYLYGAASYNSSGSAGFSGMVYIMAQSDFLMRTAWILASDDYGNTWYRKGIIHNGYGNGTYGDFSETDIAYLGSGNMIAISRHDDYLSTGTAGGIWQSQSTDGGATWSTYVRTNLGDPTYSNVPNLISYNNGAGIIATYAQRVAPGFPIPADIWKSDAQVADVWNNATHWPNPMVFMTALAGDVAAYGIPPGYPFMTKIKDNAYFCTGAQNRGQALSYVESNWIDLGWYESVIPAGHDVYSGMQNLSTYSVYDPHGRLAVTSSTTTVTDVYRNETAIVWKDFGTNYFNGFDMSFTMYIPTPVGDYGTLAIGFGNTGNSSFHKAGGGGWSGPRAVYMFNSVSDGTVLENCWTDIYHASSGVLSTNTVYYGRIVRGNGAASVQFYVYADSAHTTLVTSMSESITPSEKFRYFYAFSSEDTTDNCCATGGYIGNISLTVNRDTGMPQSNFITDGNIGHLSTSGTAGYTYDFYNQTTSVTNANVSIDLWPMSSGGTDKIGVLGRYYDTDNWVVAEISKAGPSFDIVQSLAGVVTTIDTTPISWSYASLYHINLLISGTAASATITGAASASISGVLDAGTTSWVNQGFLVYPISNSVSAYVDNFRSSKYTTVSPIFASAGAESTMPASPPVTVTSPTILSIGNLTASVSAYFGGGAATSWSAVWGEVSYSPSNATLPSGSGYTFFPVQYGTLAANQTVFFSLSGLNPVTTYYFRIYGMNAWGGGYSAEMNFMTVATGSGIPVVQTPSVTTSTSSATFSSVVLDLGNFSTLYCSFSYKLNSDSSWTSTTPEHTETLLGAGFSNTVTGLNIGALYDVRADCRYNASMHSFSAIYTFIMGGSGTGTPAVETNTAASITVSSVLLQGTLISLGNSTPIFCSFQYGLSASYGSTTGDITETFITGFSASLTGLTPSTTYHYRAVGRYATASYVYGADVTFTTLSAAPSGGLTVSGANIFRDYDETNDVLVVIEYENTYTPYYPSDDSAKDFWIQLRDTTGSTIMAQTVCPDWGHRPASIYLNADTATSIEDGLAYQVFIYGNFAPFPTDAYTLTSSDWVGNDLTFLGRWCLRVGHNMETYYDIEFTEQTSAKHEVLNEAGGAIFDKNIPGLSLKIPDYFSIARAELALSSTDYEDSFSESHLLADKMGPDFVTSMTKIGTAFGGVSATTTAQIVWWVLAIGFGLAIAGLTHSLAAGGIVGYGTLGVGTFAGAVDVKVVVILAFLAFGYFLWVNLVQKS